MATNMPTFGNKSTLFIPSSNRKRARYACIFCARAFAMMSAMEQHMIICPKRIPIKKKFDESVLSRTALESTPYICGMCSETFDSRPTWKRHLTKAQRHLNRKEALEKRGIGPLAKVSPWYETFAEDDRAALDSLAQFCLSQKDLVRAGYNLEQSVIEEHQKCTLCKKSRAENKSEESTVCRYHPQRKSASGVFHCCQDTGPGCKESEHVYPPVNQNILTSAREAQRPPSPNEGGPQKPQKRAAIALECKMVEAIDGAGNNARDEVVRIIAIDIPTGEVLVNSIVAPDGKVDDWREEWTDLDEGSMQKAIRQEKALEDYPAAREELFKHIDANTVIVGHELASSLRSLRIMHDRIVDTQILARNPIKPRLPLKTLASQFVPYQIQRQRTRHLENARAVRVLALKFSQKPEVLDEWREKLQEASKTQAAEEAATERQERAEEKEQKKEKREKRKKYKERGKKADEQASPEEIKKQYEVGEDWAERQFPNKQRSLEESAEQDERWRAKVAKKRQAQWAESAGAKPGGPVKRLPGDWR